MFYLEALILQTFMLCKLADLNLGTSVAIMGFNPAVVAIFEYIAYKTKLKGSTTFGLILLISSTALISLANNS